MDTLLHLPCVGQLMLLPLLMLDPLAPCLRRRSLLLFFCRCLSLPKCS